MSQLYATQQNVVNELEEKINQYHKTKHQMYLSCEMGTGKTYMGSQIIADYVEDGFKVFVVAPNTVITKWHDVMQSFKSDLTINQMKAKSPFDSQADVSLIASKDLNVWTKQQIDDEIGNNQPLIDDKVLLVFDEIHQAKKSIYEGFERLYKALKNNNNYLFHGVYATGTIMEGEVSEIADIIARTHGGNPSIIKDDLRNNFPRFVYNYWSDISVSTSIEDVQELEENQQEIKQEIAPIEKIELTDEQRLFMEVIESQLESANINPERVPNISSNFVDNPEKDLVYKVSRRVGTNALKKGQYIDLALPLKELNFKNTSKFQKLLNLIQNSGDDKILVYANDDDTIKTLIHVLNEHDISAFGIHNVSADQYSEYINRQFETHKVAVVEPNKVNVGIDIHAEQLVWYQFMSNIDKMIQAQRRVCRLSSQGKSLVTLFVYDTDYEDVRAKDLSNAVKHNAVTYGVKQQDNLAKLTGIILEGIDSND